MERKAALLCALLTAVLLSLGISAQGNATTAFNNITSAISVNWTEMYNPIGYGNTQVLIASLVGGVGPFTYNLSVYNALGVEETNALFPGVQVAMDSFSFPQMDSWGPGTFTANVTIVDSAYPTFPMTNSLTYLVQSTTSTSTSIATSSSVSTATSSTSASSTTSSVTSIGNSINSK